MSESANGNRSEERSLYACISVYKYTYIHTYAYIHINIHTYTYLTHTFICIYVHE